MYAVALERFDMTPNRDDNTFFKTMSEYAAKYSWYDYFARKSTSTTQIIPEQQTIYLVHSIRLCLLAPFKCKLCLREQNSKTKQKLPFTDRGNPQFFYEVVQYWVAFELVQVFHKYGLKPMFKDNLEKWSNGLHCNV